MAKGEIEGQHRTAYLFSNLGDTYHVPLSARLLGFAFRRSIVFALLDSLQPPAGGSFGRNSVQTEVAFWENRDREACSSRRRSPSWTRDGDQTDSVSEK
jgi:hypothetical protein